MKAKKIIIFIISSVIILLMAVSFIPLSYLTRLQAAHNSQIQGFYAESENSMDMVYIGGSACFVYWEPLRAWNQYGFTSYNFANNALTPEAIKYYIKEVRKTQNPKLWLIDLRPFQYGEELFHDSGVPKMYSEVPIRNGTDSMLFSKNRIELINASVKKKTERLPYYFDFTKYHSNWDIIGCNLIQSIRERSLKPFDSIDNKVADSLKGFDFVNETLPIEFTDNSKIVKEQIIPAEVNDLFLDLIDYCKQEKLTVLFIVHSYCQTSEHKAEFNYMKRILEENGFDFLNTNDYYKEINFDYTLDFYNDNHVNVFGAEKYTDFVAKYIDEHYDLPDKRNNSEYAEWDKLYIDFEVKSKESKKKILDLLDKRTKSESNTK